MSFSYSGDPSTSDLDLVRFLIQDTDSQDPLLQDEEILSLLSLDGSPYFASVRACETIAMKFARFTDIRIGDYSESASKLHDHYLKLAKTIKQTAMMKLVTPYAGGISQSEKDKDSMDSDLTQPIFKKGLFSNPGGPNSND